MSKSIPRLVIVPTVCLAVLLLLADASEACRRSKRRCSCVAAGCTDTMVSKGSPVQNGGRTTEESKDYWNVPDSPADDAPGETNAEKDYWKITAVEMPMRRWIDNTAQHATMARLYEIRDDHVRLLKDNGRFCTVPLDRLSTEDRIYVQQKTAAVGSGVVGKVVGR